MAESPPNPLLSQSRDLLATSSHKRLELLVKHLTTPKETIEFQSALNLFNFCATYFPNCLTLMLLKVYYHSPPNSVTRHHSIPILYAILDIFRARKTHLSEVALQEIKPVLIVCLENTQETEIIFFRRIVSYVAYDVVSYDGSWDELSDCILSFAKTQPLKAFHVFIELPQVARKFIERFVNRILVEAENVLFNPPDAGVWSLALQNFIKIGVQSLNSSELNHNLIRHLLLTLDKSIADLVNKGMEEFVVLGLQYLEIFLSSDKVLYGYNHMQYSFIATFLYKIRDLGVRIKEAARFMSERLCASNDGPPAESGDGGFFERWNKSSLADIVKFFMSDGGEERVKDMAIRRLNLMLSSENPKRAIIDFEEVRNLQPVLAYCLEKEGISESVFKVLGEVAYNVADWLLMVSRREETWFDLRDYIMSKSKTDFTRAVYIFQCLRPPLDEEEFVIPVMKTLLPEIMARLKPPSDVLVDNSNWVLAFGGAFCAVIHLIDTDSHNDSVAEIAYKMIDSVRELVEKDMEVGLVMRAFRDVEGFVKKYLRLFTSSEYKFVKGMVSRLYEIKGMKMESKVVLWRINFVLDRGVPETFKEVPNTDAEWLNQHDEDDDEEEDEDEVEEDDEDEG